MAPRHFWSAADEDNVLVVFGTKARWSSMNVIQVQRNVHHSMLMYPPVSTRGERYRAGNSWRM